MKNGESFSADRMAEEYLNYLFEKKADTRHVRRVESWLGLLVLGVEKIKDRWWVPRTRQLWFEVGDRRFKARFNHEPRPRGGIEFVEVEPARGQKDIRVVQTITSLAAAAAFFDNPKV